MQIRLIKSLIKKNQMQFKEPMGSIRPKFSQSSGISSFTKEQGSAFALLCAAQASPTPNFK